MLARNALSRFHEHVLPAVIRDGRLYSDAVIRGDPIDSLQLECIGVTFRAQYCRLFGWTTYYSYSHWSKVTLTNAE